MNKAHKNRHFIFTVLGVLCLILFNSGCGLDTFYVIYAPTITYNIPQCDSIQYESLYFSFLTEDPEPSVYQGIKFLGNEVFYKIYKSKDRMNNVVEDLQSIASKEDSTTSAADKMIETYSYKALRYSNNTKANIFAPAKGSSTKIEIRLSDYFDYNADIKFDGKSLYGIPVRNIPSNTPFTFSKLQDTEKPASDDADVDNSGSGNDSEWYVAMFAVAVAQDATYVPMYSNILYLGSVKIEND